MTTALETAITEALNSPEDNKLINKAYIEFIKANFIIPVEKEDEAGEPKVLFFTENLETYLPAFTDKQYLDTWADGIASDINVLTLTGVDLLKGIGENVTVCLDIGAKHYKAFNAAEIARLKGMILKFFKTP